MSQNNLGARSKIKVTADSNSRKGKKRGQNSNWGEKQLWQDSNESNKSSRNARLDTWDHAPTNSWNDAWSKKDSWEECMRKKKEQRTLWNSIEQDFPSLGVSEKKSQRNVWTERQQKREEVKSLQPTSEAEEQKMIQIALQMSKLDVRSEEANRKRLEEEYQMQEEMLKLNPDYFKEFVPEDLCNVGNNSRSEGYATAEQSFTQDYNSSKNNNWDTWNDYSNFGEKNSASSKDTSNCESIWDDCSRETTKSASQNQKQEDNESIWGEVDSTSAGNWNGYSVTEPKKNSSTKSSSNYNSVDSFNDPPLKTSQKPKMKDATRNVAHDSVWSSDSNNKNSDNWNDYSKSGNLKNSTARDGSNSKPGNQWDDSKGKSINGWDDISDSGRKKNTTSKNSPSYKDDNYPNISTDKSQEQSTKKSFKKYDKCDDIWDNDVDYRNSDNSDARDKRNYSNFEATSSYEEKPVSKGFKVSSDKPYNSNSAKIDKSISKADNKKVSLNLSSSGKKPTEDIKKVVDLFGGWGSASDYSRKPNANAKSVGSIPNSTSNSDHDYKNASHHKVTNEQSVNPTTAVASQSTTKSTIQNSSMKSKNESFQNSDIRLEEVPEIKYSDNIESGKKPQNSYFNSQSNPISKESSEAKTNNLMTGDRLTTPIVSISNTCEHHTTGSESSTELSSLENKTLPVNSSSVYIRSPKPASELLESAGISKPIESHLTTEFAGTSTLNTHCNNLNDTIIKETSQINEFNDDIIESPVINSPSVLPPADLPSESPINPILPIHPMAGGFMNPNMVPGMNPSLVPGMNPSMMPGMNPSMVPGMNPMMVAEMNPLLMQQMLFLSNPFLASQFRAMEMYYRSMGMTTVPQGMFPPQMCSTPSSFPNATDNNCDNTINAPVPPNNCDTDVARDSNSPVINPPIYTPNNKLSFSLNDDIDSSSHVLKYDPDDADLLLQQFLDPSDNDNFIPPPVMPNSRNENPAKNPMPPFTTGARKTANSNASSSVNPAEYKDSISNKNTNGFNLSSSEASWNGIVSAKEPIAVVPESAGWGDFDSDGMKSNWNDEIDGWGNENYTLKAMGNPSKYDSKKRSAIRQPSSQPTFSRYKK